MYEMPSKLSISSSLGTFRLAFCLFSPVANETTLSTPATSVVNSHTSLLSYGNELKQGPSTTQFPRLLPERVIANFLLSSATLIPPLSSSAAMRLAKTLSPSKNLPKTPSLLALLDFGRGVISMASIAALA
jgi:hypothetical protein